MVIAKAMGGILLNEWIGEAVKLPWELDMQKLWEGSGWICTYFGEGKVMDFLERNQARFQASLQAVGANFVPKLGFG